VAHWFTQQPDLGEILDRKRESSGQGVYVSDHPDALAVDRGYGKATSPKTTSNEFKASSTATATSYPRCSPCSPARVT
jgi:type I restriction enzyme R subunit